MKNLNFLLILLLLSGCTPDKAPSKANTSSAVTPSASTASQSSSSSFDGGLTSSKATQNGETENANPSLTIDVYKSPTCSCCSGWIAHLEQRGFNVRTHTMEEREQKGIQVPTHLGSCHTGVIDGKFIEGHVPAEDILAFVQSKEFKSSKGIAVPGMPIGSPGMEVGDRKDPYDVIRVDEKGQESVFIRH